MIGKWLDIDYCIKRSGLGKYAYELQCYEMYDVQYIVL